MRYIETRVWDDDLAPGQHVLSLRRVVAIVHPSNPDAYVGAVCDEVRNQFKYALERQLMGKQL